MASGFGYSGGRSRCFTYWQEFSKCYAQTDNPVECRPEANDYIECLHGPKQLARAQMIQQELIKQANAQAKDGQKAADILADGVIAGVERIQKGQNEGTPTK